MTFVVFSDLNEDNAKVYESWDSFKRTQIDYELDSDITHAWSDEASGGVISTVEPNTMQKWLKEEQEEAMYADRHENTLRYSGN